MKSSLTEDQEYAIVQHAATWGVHGDAQSLVNEAYEARDSGARGEVVTSIITLYENLTTPVVKSRIDGMYEKKELAIAKIKKEGLPIPPSIEGDPVILPRDLSVVSTATLRRLHSEFHACLARANWLVAVEDADALAADQIANHYAAKAVRAAAQEADPISGKAKTLGALEAEASNDSDVIEWRDKYGQHVVESKLLKSLRDTYLQSCERISREYTMRDNERGSV